MCGIVAYLGAAQAKTILLGGLARLEYRGYDSAGLAVMQQTVSGDGSLAVPVKAEPPSEAPSESSPTLSTKRRRVSGASGHRISVVKSAGKVSNLTNACSVENSAGTLGIAHTRWATHGPPTDVNAHPHTSSDGSLAVVHNGIVENFTALRAELVRKGYVMRSDTDTELIVHLIDDVRKQQWMPLEEAVRQAMTQVHGAFGIAVMSADDPELLIGARKGSPLILGIGEDEYILASDAAAVIERTKRVLYLQVRRGAWSARMRVRRCRPRRAGWPTHARARAMHDSSTRASRCVRMRLHVGRRDGDHLAQCWLPDQDA